MVQLLRFALCASFNHKILCKNHQACPSSFPICLCIYLCIYFNLCHGIPKTVRTLALHDSSAQKNPSLKRIVLRYLFTNFLMYLNSELPHVRIPVEPNILRIVCFCSCIGKSLPFKKKFLTLSTDPYYISFLTRSIR